MTRQQYTLYLSVLVAFLLGNVLFYLLHDTHHRDLEKKTIFLFEQIYDITHCKPEGRETVCTFKDIDGAELAVLFTHIPMGTLAYGDILIIRRSSYGVGRLAGQCRKEDCKLDPKVIK